MKSTKISLIVLTVIIAFFFLAVMPVSAEVTELWNRTYDGGGCDAASGVATDASENVIVTGAGSFGIYYTVKYDKDGTELWNRTYDGEDWDAARGVATDASENVIVTGAGSLGIFGIYYTIKYDKDGTELWNRTYDGGGRDEAMGVATDASGNVIVTGSSTDVNNQVNYYTIKYDKDGTELWNRTYDGGGRDEAMGVAMDASENVIVTGAGSLGIFGIYYTIKYDKDGTELWNRTYGSGGNDAALGVATDASGNVIVTGVSYGNYYTIKYDKDGTELWNITYDSGGWDAALGVATGAFGNIIVTGYSAGVNRNYYTIKYDKDGSELWNITYGGGGNNAAARGVATDASGNVIVTGSSADVNNQPGKYYTIKYGETTGTLPEILSYAPASPINDTEAATRTFNITIDQIVNVSWQINGTEVQLNETVTEATYTNQSAVNGTWTVSAVVSNANGTAIQAWLWHVGMNQLPIASFSYSPSNPVINQPITFNASDSTDPDGNITNYEWGFGDGVNSTNMTGPITNHTYASAGTFTVNLTVIDDDGATNATSRAITVSEGLVFDTGTGTYPSIAGTHNGTITTNVTIAVSKLYIYPCTGSGGHTKYARIWNNSGLNATALWGGYTSDWHNLTFNETVVLLANETYNYTICTGSYPQIHHNTALLTTNGWINCTEFVDANGNKYSDWIPAIKLK